LLLILLVLVSCWYESEMNYLLMKRRVILLFISLNLVKCFKLFV
jgi:hypothetical protein